MIIPHYKHTLTLLLSTIVLFSSHSLIAQETTFSTGSYNSPVNHYQPYRSRDIDYRTRTITDNTFTYGGLRKLNEQLRYNYPNYIACPILWNKNNCPTNEYKPIAGVTKDKVSGQWVMRQYSNASCACAKGALGILDNAALHNSRLSTSL